jgi:prepilin-type N-terminal cleavage/methylation domain-containing protein
VRARTADETGFTLVEMLVTLALGVLVLFTGFNVLDAGGRTTSRIQDRSQLVARGRTALDTVTRELRSQVCLGLNSPAITQADASSITFYDDLAPAYVGSDSTKIFTPERRRLVFANGTLTEYTYTGSGTAPNMTFPATPTRTRVLLTKVVASGSKPFFSYFGFTPGTSPQPTLPLAAPLSTGPTGDAARVVQIGVAFRVQPDAAHAGSDISTDFSDQVFVRTSDATDPGHSPLCA